MPTDPWNYMGLDTLKAPLITQVIFHDSCSGFLKGPLQTIASWKRLTPAWNTKGQKAKFRGCVMHLCCLCTTCWCLIKFKVKLWYIFVCFGGHVFFGKPKVFYIHYCNFVFFLLKREQLSPQLSKIKYPIYLSIHPSIHPSSQPSIHPSIYLSIYLSIYPSICLST